MKRVLYLISNYKTSLYQLDENYDCIMNDNRITIREAFEIFNQAKSVKVYGIIRATIKEYDGNNWRVINKII